MKQSGKEDRKGESGGERGRTGAVQYIVSQKPKEHFEKEKGDLQEELQATRGQGYQSPRGPLSIMCSLQTSSSVLSLLKEMKSRENKK